MLHETHEGSRTRRKRLFEYARHNAAGSIGKLDIRVKVVGTDVWAASITTGGSGIRGDWRLQKSDTDFEEFTLPREVEQCCVDLLDEMDLAFGAIDLLTRR